MTLTRVAHRPQLHQQDPHLQIKPTFRYADDKANGAVKITSRTSITLKPRQTRKFTVTMTIDASKLRDWTLDGGAKRHQPRPARPPRVRRVHQLPAGSGAKNETDPVHVAWQVLPRKSGDVRTPDGTNVTLRCDDVLGGSTHAPERRGQHGRPIDVYSLVGTSPNKPASRPGMNSPVIDLKAVGVQTFRSVPRRRSAARRLLHLPHRGVHLGPPDVAVVPGEIDVDIDVDSDGDARLQRLRSGRRPGRSERCPARHVRVRL